jgi:hypothetical protein
MAAGDIVLFAACLALTAQSNRLFNERLFA